MSLCSFGDTRSWRSQVGLKSAGENSVVPLVLQTGASTKLVDCTIRSAVYASGGARATRY
jgi:hypothetical protein